MKRHRYDKTALVILAAGAGSRYEGANKALEAVGPAGESLMDYAVYDALQAGFDKVIFVIRRDMEAAMIRHVEKLRDLPAPVHIVWPDEAAGAAGLAGRRQKPWGTAYSLLAAQPLLEEPFGVINADDWYGTGAFRSLYDFLQDHEPLEAEGRHCIGLMGYSLEKTVSASGAVTRGVCVFDAENRLEEIRETHGIRRTGQGIQGTCRGQKRRLAADSRVSMNMWGMYPPFLGELRAAFPIFLREAEVPLDSEFLLPEQVSRSIRAGRTAATLIPAEEPWLGITYREDLLRAREEIRAMVDRGIYPQTLFARQQKR